MAQEHDQKDQACVKPADQGEAVHTGRGEISPTAKAQIGATGQGGEQEHQAVGASILGLEQLQRRHRHHGHSQSCHAGSGGDLPAELMDGQKDPQTEQSRELAQGRDRIVQPLTHEPRQKKVEGRVLGMADQGAEGVRPEVEWAELEIGLKSRSRGPRCGISNS